MSRLDYDEGSFEISLLSSHMTCTYTVFKRGYIKVYMPSDKSASLKINIVYFSTKTKVGGSNLKEPFEHLKRMLMI